MRFAKQAHTQWQPGWVAERVLNVAEGAQVIGDLLDVIGVADGEPGLTIEQVGQRGLGALDLGGEERLLANGGVKQPVDRGDEAGYARQARECQFGLAIESGVRIGREGGLLWW